MKLYMKFMFDYNLYACLCNRRIQGNSEGGDKHLLLAISTKGRNLGNRGLMVGGGLGLGRSKGEKMSPAPPRTTASESLHFACTNKLYEKLLPPDHHKYSASSEMIFPSCKFFSGAE